VGINLLREGLDLPEVSLVAVLDADKEGFLRSETALIQTCGRAARHVEGRVILYADQMTNAIKFTVGITQQRRRIQDEHNQKHGIVPRSTRRDIADLGVNRSGEELADEEPISGEEIEKKIRQLQQAMEEAAGRWEYDEAARLRDQMRRYETIQLMAQEAG
jgi:excinuclease ABC subunit B